MSLNPNMTDLAANFNWHQDALKVDAKIQEYPVVSSGIPAAEISHFDELVRAGRIIAILAWADRMAGACADFRPMSENIDFLCKTLNLRGLGELAEKLRGNPGPGV